MHLQQKGNDGGILLQNGTNFTEYSLFTSSIWIRTLGERYWKQKRISFAYCDFKKLSLERMTYRTRDRFPGNAGASATVFEARRFPLEDLARQATMR